MTNPLQRPAPGSSAAPGAASPAVSRAIAGVIWAGAGLALSLSLAGCATVGRPFPPEQVQAIRLNETTKTQLLGMFGLPYRRGIEDGDSTWTYLHYKYRVFGEHLRTRDLYVRFDSGGQVKSFSYNSNMPE